MPLAKGRNEVRITLDQRHRRQGRDPDADHEGEGDLDKRGTLYILAIGVDEYPGLGNTCGRRHAAATCKYSGADARRLAEAVEKRLGPGHSQVVKRVLVNGGDAKDAPTASNILDAIDLLKQAKETDTVVLFIAGHGYNDGPDYRFLPTDAEWIGGALRGSTVVPWQILQEAVEAAKGRRCCSSTPATPATPTTSGSATPPITPTSSPTRPPASTRRRWRTPRSATASSPMRWSRAWRARAVSQPSASSRPRSWPTTWSSASTSWPRPCKGEQEPQYFKGRDAEDYVLAQW